MIPYLVAFCLSAIFVLITLPLFAKIARMTGLVDRPDNKRKLHATAIPMVGGIAVAIGTLFSAVLIAYFFEISFSGNNRLEYIGLAIGAAIILAVGILDDRFSMRGRQKLAGQIIAATALILCGYRIKEVAFASMEIEFGIFSLAVTYLWILVAINSVNLLDGADGFATTIGIVMFGALSFMTMYSGARPDSVICLAICGALLGFLFYNFPPAKAYLGDAGSMLIGFALAAITIRCSFKQATAYAFFAPVALLGIPLIDTGAAILRRRLTGRSIYTTDRGHLHHAMAKKGLSPRSSLLWVAFLTLTTATGAILSLVTEQSEFAIISIGIVLAVLVVGRIFGSAEFELVSGRALGLAKSFLQPSKGKKVQQSTIQLQGSRNWKVIWKQLCDFGEENSLNEIMLDVNAPWIHESFHAKQKLKNGKDDRDNEEWRSEVPLISQGRLCGRIQVWNSVDDQMSHHQVVINLLKISSDIELAIDEMSNEGSATAIELNGAENETIDIESGGEVSTKTPAR